MTGRAGMSPGELAEHYADMLIPVDGPHTPEGVSAAAALVSELIRRLNHATLPDRVRTSLPYPSHVDTVVSELGQATTRFEQLAAQLRERLLDFGHDDRTGVDELGPQDTAHSIAVCGAAELDQATGQAAALGGHFRRARKHTSRLTYRTDAR